MAVFCCILHDNNNGHYNPTDEHNNQFAQKSSERGIDGSKTRRSVTWGMLMQKINLYKVQGAEIKREKSGILIVGFSSQSILDSQLIELNFIKENFFLGFYCCSFYDCDLGNIKSERVESIGIFHSTFGDKELKTLSHLSNINLIKLVDTSVTAECICAIEQANGKIKIST